MKTLSITLILLFNLSVSSAQVTLTINCQQEPQDNYFNSIFMDSNLVEYGLCSFTPSFYVTIIDTNCSAWGTKYTSTGENLENDFGNSNNDGACAPRVMRHFVYKQTDSLQLVYLDSLLNFWIPNDHVIAIWTPLSFDFNSINNLYPPLANTLINKWGNDVQTNSMIVLFGVEGFPTSFSVDTLNSGSGITISKSICQYSSLSIPESDKLVTKSLVKIVDAMGRETEEKPNTILIYIYSDGTSERVFRVE
ncbi:MAG: hypothetical protein ACJAUD_001826 [Crocinitomicaceae bacterium]|jgi:hypothetical protein